MNCTTAKTWTRWTIDIGMLCLLALAAVPVNADDEQRVTAATTLETALATAAQTTDPAQQVALLSQAATNACRQVPENFLLAEMVQKLSRSSETDPRRLATQWRQALTSASEMLRFQVLNESPLPDGFPAPTPVGELRVQQYPAYRLARTDMTFIEGRAFWTLFNHIKAREIAMTAPVELTYQPDSTSKKQSMAFLYRSPQQGSVGQASGVDVIDVPASTAVSIGVRGDATSERVASAKQRLDVWLQAHAGEYEAAGPLRVLAYNSPFTADAKKFTEVQIPLRLKNR